MTTLKLFQVSLLTICSLLSLQSKADENSGFFNIGHMANTKQAVDWAVHNGSNAIEVDLHFDKNGSPDKFYHGFPCDCSCNLFNDAKICNHLGDNPCEAHSPVKNLLTHMATKTQLSLIIIDSKLRDIQQLHTAGANVITYIDEWLFNKGYKGNVLISIANPESFNYMISAAGQAALSDNASRYYFSIDQNENNTVETIDKLITLQPETYNRIYGTGTHKCSLFPAYYDAIQLARENHRKGVLSSVYIWTIDDTATMEKYIRKGVLGIITNHPARLRTLLLKKGIKLSLPGSDLQPAISDNIIKKIN